MENKEELIDNLVAEYRQKMGEKRRGMTIKTFIEKAIEGGWKPDVPHLKDDGWNEVRFLTNPDWVRFFRYGGLTDVAPSSIILDPLAWQAVGKVEGWKKDEWFGEIKRYGGGGEAIETREILWLPWQFKMHRFIEALCDGKDLEGAVEEATS